MVEKSTRYCRWCGQDKPLDEFYHRRTGYARHQCKSCEKQYNWQLLQERKRVPAIYRAWREKLNRDRKVRKLKKIMEKHGNPV